MKKNIVVVWGWSSGWLSAAMFLKSFGEDFNIILVADETIGNIWVGEATIPCIKGVFEFLDIPESDWLSYCRGSFKYGINFENWNEKRDFTHPYYDSIGDETYENFLKYWAFLRARNILWEEFDEVSGILPYMMRERLYSSEIHDDIAYHFDTGKLGEFLRDWAIAHGAQYINGHVESSQQDEKWNISKLILKNGEQIQTDFLIDCSWFASLFLEWVHEEEYVSFSEELLCDTAIVRWFDYSDTKKQRVPYTSAIAMENGWMWKIPLKDRLSVWYVFSKKHTSVERVQEEMMNSIDLDPINDFRIIYFKSGYHKKSWVKNTLGIWLSYGFIEPLESTGIFLMYTSLFMALDTFRHYISEEYSDTYVSEYNAAMEALIHDIKNYVVYHYILNEKKGIFWEDARNVWKDTTYPQIWNLWFTNGKAFSYDLYHEEQFWKEAFFKDLSYYYILTGMKNIWKEESQLDISDEKITKLRYVFSQRKKSLMDKVQNKQSYDSFLETYYNIM